MQIARVKKGCRQGEEGITRDCIGFGRIWVSYVLKVLCVPNILSLQISTLHFNIFNNEYYNVHHKITGRANRRWL